MTVAIIGCGSSGAAIASQLIYEAGIDKIKLLDIDAEKSTVLSVKLSKINPKIDIESHQINANKVDELISLFKDERIVINAASPVYNIPIMKACIKTKSNYIDLGSDPFKYEGIQGETSLDDQLPYDRIFRKNNLVALTNAGASPGFSDSLSRHAAETNQFRSLENVKIYFSEKIESDVFISSWSPYILFLESLLPATIYKNDTIHTLPSCERRRKINLPNPFNQTEITLFNGHPELRTIPQFLTIPVSYVEVGGSIVLNEMNLDGIILESLRRKINDDITFNGDIFEQLSNSFEPTHEFVNFFEQGKIKKEILFCYTEIIGKRNNERIQYTASTTIDLKEIHKTNPFATATSYMVSVIPTLVTRKILENKLDDEGVLAPAALDISSELIDLSKNFNINFKEEKIIL
jgi:hypothetical protein